MIQVPTFRRIIGEVKVPIYHLPSMKLVCLFEFSFYVPFFFYCFLFLNESYVSLIKRNEKKRKGKVFGSLDLESIFRRCS